MPNSYGSIIEDLYENTVYDLIIDNQRKITCTDYQTSLLFSPDFILDYIDKKIYQKVNNQFELIYDFSQITSDFSFEICETGYSINSQILTSDTNGYLNFSENDMSFEFSYNEENILSYINIIV